MTQTALHQLKNLTTVVADSSDLEAIEKFRPLDATTNPSLITAAAEQPESKQLIEEAYTQAKQEGYQSDELIERTIDILTVKFGVEILKLIDGRVSTEVDASLSYDTDATIAKARELSKLYQGYGIEQSRILIKIASTWEGIQAAKVLEAEGIPCNLTLLFGLHQAQACADAKNGTGALVDATIFAKRRPRSGRLRPDRGECRSGIAQPFDFRPCLRSERTDSRRTNPRTGENLSRIASRH